ncbi:unnamed protein product [Rotaria sordida]|uniref:NAD(P)(+)--arginine ADP-ribosyltransferase n=1 Tax=Rotaria sordida TaxID=392033 RepID=A0A815BS49_9BILA|nr:unnamed protein product [Rotaria sordida]CAF4115001.1 unnamed protein product [Rotaria sordida]
MDSHVEEKNQRDEKHKFRAIEGENSYSETVATNFKTFFDISRSGCVIEAIRYFGKLLKRSKDEINEVIDPFLENNTDHPFLCIFAYTKETFLVYKMNDSIRSDSKEQLNAIYPYVNVLINALNPYPFYGTVYRGFLLNSEQLSKYKKDRTFFWPGFSSATKKFAVAARFAQCNVVFEIRIPEAFSHCCGDISDKSAYPEEEEVLLKPYTYFRVLDTKTQTHNKVKYTIPILLVEATALTLSGAWKSNDDDDYFICQYGRQVFWYARSSENKGYNWSHVAYGIISDGDIIHLTFGDLPIGKDRYTGNIDIQISSDYANMTKILDAKNIFLTKSWSRISAQYYQNPISTRLSMYRYDDSDQLTGHWKCNDDGNYYISRFNESIFWLGYHPRGRWCNVAVGKMDKSSGIIDLNWGDIVCGADRLYGTLKLLVKKRTMKKLDEQLKGINENTFLGTEWYKVDVE